MGPGWNGLVPCTSQSCESNKRVYTGQTDTTTTTTTGIHATDPLLVSTTPYYAHLYPLLLRARGALQDLDRTPQEPGRYDDYHDQGAPSYARCL
jgi:hypothetical protein